MGEVEAGGGASPSDNDGLKGGGSSVPRSAAPHSPKIG